ncbi:unnamed protein product [Orchesella dallaii]|uniref:Uncharacterized protein n=1 Tax=Orchesella dallaii TaxID=48710 RepID=A0ABP1RLS7_9HEXA
MEEYPNILQMDMVLERMDKLKLPTAVLSWIQKTPSRHSFWSANTIMSESLLFFVTLHDQKVAMSCFSCISYPTLYFVPNRHNALYFKLLELPKKFISSFKNLKQFWKNIHSTLDFGPENKIPKCSSFSVHMKGTEAEEQCEIYWTFIQYRNCSNFKFCKYFFHYKLNLRISPSSEFQGGRIFHHAQNQIDFTLQILFPSVQFLDTGLNAFFTPFLLAVWLNIFVCMAVILFWLALNEGLKVFQVLFWQFSVLVEQDLYQLRVKKIQSHCILVIFILSAFLFRQFYNSSLYSFMVAVPPFTNYPKNMQELLNQTEFGILAPNKFWMEIYMLFWTLFPNKNPELAIFLQRIVLGSYFMKRELEIETLHNASSQIQLEVEYYSRIRGNGGSRLATVFAINNETSTILSKFGVICDENCDGYWKLPFLGHTHWNRAVEREMRFFTAYQAWILTHLSFATFSFSKFLGLFVESGLQVRASRRYRVYRQYRDTKGLKNLRKMGITNGSLLSYLSLGKDVNRLVTEKEEPTTISAFIGTFIITSVFLTIGSVILGFEIWVYYLGGKCRFSETVSTLRESCSFHFTLRKSIGSAFKLLELRDMLSKVGRFAKVESA